MMAYVFWVSPPPPTPPPPPPSPLSSLSLSCGLYSYNIKTVFANHNILEKAYFILEKCTVLHFLAR